MNKPGVLAVETKKGFFRALLAADLQAKPWEITKVTDTHAAMDVLSHNEVAVVVVYCGEDSEPWEPLLEHLKQHDVMVIRLSVTPQAAKVNQPLVEIHPILAATCPLEELISAIDRSFQAWLWLQAHPMMETLLAKLRYLPSPPALYFALRDEIDSPISDLRRIVSLLARDTALVARLLRVANSGFYARPRQITDLHEAVGLLGLDLVLGIVLSAHLFEHVPLPGLNLEQLWKHNFAVARVAQRIAKMQGCRQEQMNAAGLAGLLHDLGRLVLLANLPGSYPGLIHKSKADERQLVRLERQRWGAGHPEIGAMVLSLWNIADPVVEAVACHHDLKEETFHQAHPIAQAVFAAELLVNEFTHQRQSNIETGESCLPSLFDQQMRTVCAPLLSAALK